VRWMLREMERRRESADSFRDAANLSFLPFLAWRWSEFGGFAGEGRRPTSSFQAALAPGSRLGTQLLDDAEHHRGHAFTAIPLRPYFHDRTLQYHVFTICCRASHSG